MAKGQFVYHRGFVESVRDLFQKGGQPRKAAEKVQALIQRVDERYSRPLEGFALTHHGESRIAHAVKYELGFGAHRLVTIQHDGLIGLMFAGSHDDTERWLDRNRGIILARRRDGAMEILRDSATVDAPPASPPTDFSVLPLLERIPSDDVDYVLDSMKQSEMRLAMALDSMSSDSDIERVCERQSDPRKAVALLNALLLLRGGEVDEARRRIEVLRGTLVPLSDVRDVSLIEIRDGETVKLVPVGSGEYSRWFDWFMRTADYRSWMLFLHPDQQEWVDRDFTGPASLTGISGSGKTAIAVMRAIRLAKTASEDCPVLLVTLNRSLALLITDLVDHACRDDLRKRIQVTSFFEYAQSRLLQFEIENRKLYVEVTWKGNEHIDEIWREFYRCYLNSNDAKVLDPIHRTLTAREVNAEAYVREEFDWVRSGFGLHDRGEYLAAHRTGRHVPFDGKAREAILNGLSAWQQKMRFVGVTDHLGLAAALSRHAAKLTPNFSHIIVDEAQDFGTLELSLLRLLVPIGTNDIFLCGDPAQRVHPKHRALKQAGIDVPSARSFTLKRNYRNTREILTIADRILVRALQGTESDPDLIRIEPEFAPRSGPPPLLLAGATLEQEIAAALLYSEETEASDTKRFCIAVAGYSLREIQAYAQRRALPVLDGTIGLGAGKVFLSDLEQTKGYEFDTICVLNCSADVLPSPDLPPEEQFRLASRLYVAMTRAKHELILSFNGAPSSWICDVEGLEAPGAWIEHVDSAQLTVSGIPERLPELPPEGGRIGALTGREFLYTRYARGMSPERQERLIRLISGRMLIRDGHTVEWRCISDAAHDIELRPRARRAFGEDSWRYFRDLFQNASLAAAAEGEAVDVSLVDGLRS